ncbi:hypothetical protein XF_0046 [Xylella fastidiosa 9a5c]|uniref:Uncharacterized protein n=1 Tax=Xylella fastidiosa (strain 9a5c) TaxID=160492 RepID=Q9PH98_XYLFA|nr:hypothetical protein XF_0046 [Xylella fastidiosa 9a5c]
MSRFQGNRKTKEQLYPGAIEGWAWDGANNKW